MEKFKKMLFFGMLFAAILTLTYSDDYIPCNSYISFSYDDSITLAADAFKTQMSFISTEITKLNHPERLRGAGIYSDEFEWKSGLTLDQMKENLAAAQQSPNHPYSLKQQFANIKTGLNLLNDCPGGGYLCNKIAVIIFISDTSDKSIENAAQQFPNGIQITFILMGENVESNKLRNFSNNFIHWDDLTQPQPDGWKCLANSAYGCTDVSPPPECPTTSPPNNNDGPYKPCKSWISFSIDDSNTLFGPYFKQQITFLSLTIGTINHPERIQAIGMYSIPVLWENQTNIEDIQNLVANMSPGTGPYHLSTQLQNFVSMIETLNNYETPYVGIIFISDTSDEALKNTDIYVSLLANIQLTFVLLGENSEETKLAKFNNAHFIYWRDFSKTHPDNWDDLTSAAYGCTTNLPIITTLTTNKITTTPTTTTKLLPPTTTTTHKITTTTTITPPDSCVDIADNCAQSSYYCTDVNYYPIMLKKCIKTCNFCNYPCFDINVDCMKDSYLCTNPNYIPFMHQQCKKTCKFCQ